MCEESLLENKGLDLVFHVVIYQSIDSLYAKPFIRSYLNMKISSLWIPFPDLMLFTAL